MPPSNSPKTEAQPLPLSKGYKIAPDENKQRNTFAEKSADYALSRPQYPEELYEWILGHCKQTSSSWDCATGNGQAAIHLSQHFGKVIATDVSEEQVAHAHKRDNIEYLVCSAEDTPIEDHSIDLITVAQALHWFNYKLFWPEVTRVSRPGAFFCAWGYAWLFGPEIINEKLIVPFRKAIEPFWAPNNRILWDGYKPSDVQFPFKPVEAPDFEICVDWSLENLLNYIMTWSAYKVSRNDMYATKVIDDIVSEITALVPREEVFTIRMPLSVIAGNIQSDSKVF